MKNKQQPLTEYCHKSVISTNTGTMPENIILNNNMITLYLQHRSPKQQCSITSNQVTYLIPLYMYFKHHVHQEISYTIQYVIYRMVCHSFSQLTLTYKQTHKHIHLQLFHLFLFNNVDYLLYIWDIQIIYHHCQMFRALTKS